MEDRFSTIEKMNNDKTESRPELLAPAGSFDALCAAIEGGADAVYMGGVAFNARINAKNFTPDEMRRAIALAHTYGVKVYIAANTLIYDRERESFIRAAEDAYLAGADALILADLGCASLIKQRVPIELHASTQMSGHSVAASRELARLGFSRMVCAREMSCEDLRTFTRLSEIEAEVFVHGALCVCHSGQCLFSSLVGQRSGNRGECAQPCRLPYKMGRGEGYPLSLKDLSLAEHVPELCDMGVASFKIEGRMKSPEYVRDVTRIWRRLLDERRSASGEEMRELAEIFSRQGFTDGYFVGKIDRKMLGVRKEENKENSRNLQKFDKIERKIPVKMEFLARVGEPVALNISCAQRGVSAEVIGDVPDVAHTRPLDAESVRKSLSKLGSTSFCAEDIGVDIEGDLILAISSLNALRRAAVEALESKLLENYSARSEKDLQPIVRKPDIKSGESATSAFFSEPASLTDTAREYFDIVYLPLEKYDGSTSGVAMPAVVFDSEREAVLQMLDRAKALGAEHILVQNIAQLEVARKYGFEIHASMRLNACNSDTVRELLKLGADEVILSPELTLAQLRDMPRGTSACVYGRIPLMITEKCASKELADCRTCEAGRVELVDRRSVRFPVLKAFGHRSEIYNSVPIYMADRTGELPDAKKMGRHFIFSIESADEVDRIIRAYEKKAPPADSSRVRRIK
ncbi:MAG: U32 family peptidase [Clostridia bacterium]|nr:U32 family peptidase [Clostridia bacterium]